MSNDDRVRQAQGLRCSHPPKGAEGGPPTTHHPLLSGSVFGSIFIGVWSGHAHDLAILFLARLGLEFNLIAVHFVRNVAAHHPFSGVDFLAGFGAAFILPGGGGESEFELLVLVFLVGDADRPQVFEFGRAFVFGTGRGRQYERKDQR